LPNTPREVLAIRGAFERSFSAGDIRLLQQAAPTEEQIRATAGGCDFVHLATHGYFAPPELRSALAGAPAKGTATPEFVSRQDVAGFHPGLLSGIVLAGANRETRGDQDDGILTALEIAELDLRRVTLATLSACQTGLGETAGGEGLLGLQRAFQTAGARSVVASLWTVRDDATRQLMIDFYDNLWTKKMSKIAALREAQLTMLRDGLKPDPGAPAAARGLKLDPAGANRPSPYYWAPFILSGDWR
jgi:CHAT domain-containing protein